MSTASSSPDFEPITVGAWTLPQRFVMAPLTRNRAGEGGVPTELNVEYYRQRASAGLIITEGTQPSAVGQGYLNTPGIHSDEQVRGWRAVTDAVHAEGGRIVVQLMHAGRIAHPTTRTASSRSPRAPSPRPSDGHRRGAEGPPTPRALETDEIPGIVEDFVHASRQPSPPASTVSRSTPRTATSCTSSSPRRATPAPTRTAARPRTAPGSPSR